MSDNEILYNKDGNIIGEEDVAEGLKEIMEYHMNKFSKRLDVFAALASAEDKDKDKETRHEARDGMIFIKQVCSLQRMIIESPRNKMLATRLDCLIGPELSKPYRAGLALTESCSCAVRFG